MILLSEKQLLISELSLANEYFDHHADSQEEDTEEYVAYNHLTSGCPNFIPKNKVYNVLKYHSDFRNRLPDDADTSLPSYGVIDDAVSLDSNFDDWNTNEYTYPGYTTTPFGSDRFLNITNAREIIPVFGDPLGYFTDEANKSIMNIPVTDELRAVDGNGDFVFNLFEKAQAVSIDNPDTGLTTTENVDSMEFMFFHSKVEKCQEGWIYLELSNFDLSGYTNDNMIYCYYWEGTEAESLTTESQVTSGTQPITDPNFRMLNNENRCVQCFRMSDLTSGTGKKLIIGCNKYTTNGEELYINLMIGLKPSDVTRHFQYKEVQTATSPNAYTVNNCSFDEVGSPVFKYKEAEFKFSGELANTWNNKPLFYPAEGFVDPQTGADSVHLILGNRQFLDENDEGVRTPEFRTTATTRHGLPNGGLKSSVSGQSIVNSNSPSNFGNTGAMGQKEPCLITTAHGSYNGSFGIAKIGRILGSSLKQDTTFVFRMPQIYGSMGGTSSGWDVSDNIETFSSANFSVNLYVGDDAIVLNELIKWKDLSDSLYLIQTWSLATFYSNYSQCYDAVTKAGTYPTYNEEISNGYPFNSFQFPNIDQDKIDSPKFVDIDLADIVANGNGVLPDFNLYLALESTNGGITKTHSHACTDEGGTPTGVGFVPSGYATSSEPASSESASLLLKSMYDTGAVVGTTFDQGTTIGNCGSMFFKAPSIIPIGTTATPENYYQ